MSKPKSRYLRAGHPSYACHQAWFLYAMENHRGPGFCRLILVEAKNHAAVSFLERVTDDGRVSKTCALMAVLRDSTSVGIRSDMTEEVDFPAFANDIVDRSRVDRDPLAAEAYREAVAAKPADIAPGDRHSTPSPSHERNHDLAVAALVELGYKRKQAEDALKNLNLEGASPEIAVKAALRRFRNAEGL